MSLSKAVQFPVVLWSYNITDIYYSGVTSSIEINKYMYYKQFLYTTYNVKKYKAQLNALNNA